MKLGPLQTKWVEELESGKYEQGEMYLCFKNEYCCLGIAAEHVLDIEPVVLGDTLIFNKGSSELSDEDYLKLGLRNNLGMFEKKYVHPDHYISLSEMNDSGMSFVEIAKFIRENPETVFTKSV